MTDILILSDIHGSSHIIDFLHNEIPQIDIIAIAGDFTTFGGYHVVEPILSTLHRLNAPIVAVCGNCDLPEINDLMIEQGISVDGRTRTIHSVTFVGLGGSLPCPGHTPNETEDQQFGEGLKQALGSWKGSSEQLIVLTHQPAYGTTLDLTGHLRHTGSRALRRFIEMHRPILAISGHIHEARGIDHIGPTTLVNPGPFKAGYYAIAQIEGPEVRVQLKEMR